MASADFDPKTGKALICWRYPGGRSGVRHKKTVKVASAREADRIAASIEETIQDIERGRLALPPGADVETIRAFILSGGKVAERPRTGPDPKALTLSGLFDHYRAEPPSHLEESTRKMVEIHFRRILEIFPGTTPLAGFSAQGYVNKRKKATYRGRAIQRETISKELKTLRSAWDWVATHVPGTPPPPFTLKGLSLPKASEPLPFMTWEEIAAEVARGGLADAERKALWNCLWLDRPRLRALIAHVRERPGPAYLHPMVAAAAFTGARRSELCRSRVADWRFDSGMVKIRQKKRDKDKEFTFRDVPLHPELAPVMKEWFGSHPGGSHAFCREDGGRLSWDAAAYHFREALAGSEWSVVKGWHVLRHSFASILAEKGVDQRKIDRWMGHSTEIRWRYQHVRPDDQQEAISSL